VFEFEITSNCSNTAARTGIFHTPNGQVNTPKFMPVGTLATVKGISSKQLTSTGSEMILSNTFHLHLQPGEKLVKESGGIHKFMNWPNPILTDSGGYQVFSLAKLNNISDNGIFERDELVIDNFFSNKIPICGVLGGGYNEDFNKLVELHSSLHKTCAKFL